MFREIVGWPTIAVCGAIALVALILLGGLLLQPVGIESIGIVDIGPGALRIEAPIQARVVKIKAFAGEMVVRGQVLALLTSAQTLSSNATDADADLAVLAQRRASLDAETAESSARISTKRADLQTQISLEREAIAALEAQVPRLQQAGRSARESLRVYQLLMTKGFVRRSDLRAREQEVLSRDQEVDSVLIDLRARKARIASMEGDLALLAQTIMAQKRRTQSTATTIESETRKAEARTTFPVLSPASGRIRTSMSQVGAVVTPGKTLFLLDQNVSHYNVIVDLPAGESAGVRVGSSVYIRYASTSASEAASYRGRVERIEGFGAGALGTTPTYRLFIGGVRATDGNSPLPPIGATLRVSIALPDNASTLSGIRRLLRLDEWLDAA